MEKQLLQKKRPTWLKWSIWILGGGFGLFLVLLIVGILSAKNDPEIAALEAANEVSADSLRQANELEDRRTDTLSTAHFVAKQYLTKSLKDPDSFEEIEHEEHYVTPRTSTDPYIQVIVSYRAKNSFGGFVVNKKAFDFNTRGDLYNAFEPK